MEASSQKPDINIVQMEGHMDTSNKDTRPLTKMR